MMNSSNNNTPLTGRPKKKGFKGTPKSNKKNNGMSKQIGTKINDKKRQFSFKKRLVYSGHHESTKFPISFENQGTNICFFQLSHADFTYLLSKTTLNNIPMIIKWQF